MIRSTRVIVVLALLLLIGAAGVDAAVKVATIEVKGMVCSA